MSPLEYGAGAYFPQPDKKPYIVLSRSPQFFYAASDGNMIVYLSIENILFKYLSGVMPPLEKGVRAYFPQPTRSNTLCVKKHTIVYAASDVNMIVYLTLKERYINIWNE